jgi:hypothetical protein
MKYYFQKDLKKLIGKKNPLKSGFIEFENKKQVNLS